MTTTIGYLLFLLIGVSLSMFGSGGSLLAFPVFIYLFSLTPLDATTYSLGIVFVGAVISFLRLKKVSTIPLRVSLYFAIPSAISVLLTRKCLLPILPKEVHVGLYVINQPDYITTIFIIVALLASYNMIRKTHIEKNNSLQALPFFGAITGILTGLIGSGGGFVIIPVLKRYAGMQLSQAVTTSLLLVIINSFVGIVTSAANTNSINIMLLIEASFFVIIGTIVGGLGDKILTEHTKETILGSLLLIVALLTALLM